MIVVRRTRVYIIFKNSLLYYFLLKFRNQYKNVIVKNTTKLVIEGFPRSGNTFAHNIFMKSFLLSENNSNKNIAHHIHTIAQIRKGIKRKIPTLILIRNPFDAVASLLIKFDYKENFSNYKHEINSYLYYYNYFYSYVCNNFDSVLIVSFDEIINNYDRTMIRFNKKFNCNFAIINPDPSITQSIFKNIETRNIKKVKYEKMRLAIPSVEKDMLKKSFKKSIESSPLFPESMDIFKKLTL